MSASISSFFANVLQAPLRNIRWSWGAHNPDTGVVILRLWRDRIRGDQSDIEVFRVGRSDDLGQKERARHIETIEQGARAFGVVCDREHPSSGSEPTAITRFDRESLLALGPVSKDADGVWRLKILGSVSVQDYLATLPSAHSEQTDIERIEADASLSRTEKTALAKARLGQGAYKAAMMELWDNRCAVTGCAVQEVLRASHAKPWRLSDNSERLNPHNGLPLVATLDALFDAGLIAFEDSGRMLVSQHVDREHRQLLSLPAALRKPPSGKQKAFLAWHRENVFSRRDRMPA
ncbi:TPA: HNH endonuclease [Burkholderia vietnamiensis]|nr:HNH endonuclease [Burkholderia vietnamiensis]HEP6283949.1 HNH endonuclease [Burkholderia vietnamiensis]HEP6309415.1 HNH endonuclease [Burkholderia vietnamiensis]